MCPHGLCLIFVLPDISQNQEKIIQYEIGLIPHPEYHFLSDWKSIPYDYLAMQFVIIRPQEHFQELHFQFLPSTVGFHITSC